MASGERQVRGWPRHVPNVLTTFRLLAIPPFVLVLARAEDGQSTLAWAIFAAAAITDYADGYLARRLRVQSRYGRLIDPLADRLLIASAVILLWHHDRVPAVAALLILGRDLLLLSGLSLLADRGYELSVLLLGKTATFVLMVALGLIMLTAPGTTWVELLLDAGIALSLLAAVLYLLTVPQRLRAARGQDGDGAARKAS
jgi:CDP-diacylglycerol--glycerol-3-phosphate 3-phosphatidyltransferase